MPVTFLLSLGAPALASAASAPAVSTSSAVKVGQSTAVLRGAINPRDVSSTASFQYGTTKKYGAATAAIPVAKSTKTRSISAAIGGLAPATTYHYRVVGVSGAGTRYSGDRTFRTQKQPLGLTLAATPNPVPFGGSTTVGGTLSGTDNANKQIVLQQNAFPFTAGFATVGNPQVTTATGTFAFPILALTTTTQYRVAVTGRSTASPIVTALVAVTVRTDVGHTPVKRGSKLRFAGSITPIRDGANVAVQKERDGQWITIAGSIARHYKADRSKYEVYATIHSGGSYRVFVGTNSGDISNNVGRTVTVHSYR